MMLVKDDITIIAAPAAQVSSKNCAPFTKCNTKIDWWSNNGWYCKFRFGHVNKQSDEI